MLNGIIGKSQTFHGRNKDGNVNGIAYSRIWVIKELAQGMNRIFKSCKQGRCSRKLRNHGCEQDAYKGSSLTRKKRSFTFRMNVVLS